jgi:hypothetical protein
MTDAAPGTGQAFDATVEIGEAEQVDEQTARIAALERKVEKQRAHLAEAEAALAAAKEG